MAKTKRLANDAIPKVQLLSAENALTFECGEFDESTSASCVENYHCCRLGVVLRMAEGFSETGGRFCMKKLILAV